MPNTASFCDRFWARVDFAIEKRIAELLPKDRIISDLTGAYLEELTQPPELPHMPIQDFPVTLSGDAPFGYRVIFPVPTNKRGTPINDPANMTSTNDAICTAQWLAPGHIWLKPVDATNPGDTCLITGSYVDGDADDIRFPVTIGQDRILSSLDGASIEELTSDPTAPAGEPVVVAPADPVNIPPEAPADPAPADPAPPAEPTA